MNLSFCFSLNVVFFYLWSITYRRSFWFKLLDLIAYDSRFVVNYFKTRKYPYKPFSQLRKLFKLSVVWYVSFSGFIFLLKQKSQRLSRGKMLFFKSHILRLFSCIKTIFFVEGSIYYVHRMYCFLIGSQCT